VVVRQPLSSFKTIPFVSPDVPGGYDKTIRLVDVRNGTELRRFEGHESVRLQIKPQIYLAYFSFSSFSLFFF
jgi:hypothetical protein